MKDIISMMTQIHKSSISLTQIDIASKIDDFLEIFQTVLDFSCDVKIISSNTKPTESDIF